MCRLTSYIGPPATLSSILLEPPHSLLHQSYAPKLQRRGKVNADGFGVGWYDFAARREPARYRSTYSIWADASFASFAPVIRTTALLGSVRSATPPNPIEPSGVAPYTSGHWLFAHNGLVEGWRSGADGREGVRGSLAALVSGPRLAGIDGSADSELIFAMVLDRLDEGASPADALRATVEAVTSVSPACLNMILNDGQRLAATVYGESLFVRSNGEGVTVASEPLDEEPGWEQVPEGSILEVTDSNVTTGSL